MRRKQQLSGLVHVTGLKYRAAQADLSRLKDVEMALRQNLEQLTQSREVQARAHRQSHEAALVAGADIRWHQWVDQRRATINLELAENLAKQAVAKNRLRIAFGQDGATQRLLKKTCDQQIRHGRRRRDYES